MTWCAAVMICLGLVGGCRPSEEESKLEAQVAAFATLQENYEALGTLRAAADEMRVYIAEGELGDEETGLSPEEDAQQRQTELDAKGEEIVAAADGFAVEIVSFLNDNAPFEGEAGSEDYQTALAMKTAEDIELALEYVVRNGDYTKAIKMLESTRRVDPDNAVLLAEIDRLESLRYMDHERFDQINKGMKEAEVVSILGQVNNRNVKDYTERKIIAWFYPKEAGAAVAIFFQRRGGELLVYDKDFNAVKPALDRIE